MRHNLFTIPVIDYDVKSFGFMMMIAFLTGTWLGMRRASRRRMNPDVILNCALVALLAGVVGGRIFFVVHYWEAEFAFADHPLLAAMNITGGGLEWYGGLIGAMLGVTLYLFIGRHSFRAYMDAISPSAMWGLGLGRIGCFLNGCCWGGICATAAGAPALPWAVEFPFGSPAMVRQWQNRQLKLPAELITTGPYGMYDPFPLGRDAVAMSADRRDAPEDTYRELEQKYREAHSKNPDSKETALLAKQVEEARNAYVEHQAHLGGLAHARRNASHVDPHRHASAQEVVALAGPLRSLPVHPTQLYSTVNALLLSWVLSALYYRRKRHGVVFGVMLLLYPITRTIIELIRVDNPKDQFGGLTISQAVSVGMFLFGVIYLIIIRRLPERSPKAVDWVPPEPTAKAATAS